MATTLTYIDYVCEQLDGVGEISYKKMFGEFLVYLNGKPVITVCDNTCYVKKLPCTENLLSTSEVGYPYTNAKEHFVLNIDDAELSKEVIIELEKVTPLPKKKKTKSS